MSTSPSAGDGSQKQPKKTGTRTSRPKVKTGCTNCKLRRIKCDEKRPSCSQCVKSKKACTGYPPPPRRRPFEEAIIAPRPTTETSLAPARSPAQHLVPTIIQAKPPRLPQQPLPHPRTPPLTPTATASSLTLHRPSFSLAFDPQEGLYFQLFRERTASELSGFFDSSFWTRSVLQECHAEEAVRHSVVALGALYKTLEKMTESPPTSPGDHFDPTDNAKMHWEVAFRHYSDALTIMFSSAQETQSSQRSSLMATVLLACFDSFIGDHKQAIVQIQNGLRLLEKLREERRRAFLPKPEEPVEQDLIQMFTRLAIQAKSYDMAFHFPHPFVIRLTPQEGDAVSPSSEGGSPVSTNQTPIPERFESLIEGRLAWDALLEKIFRFTETMFQFTTSTSPMGILPISLKQYGMVFRNEIEAWSRAFDDILASRTAPGKSSQEKAAIAVLKMFQIMGQVLFLMTFSDSELQFDAFLPQFQAIVDLASEVVGDEERRAAARRCPDPRWCQHAAGHTDIFGGHEFTAPHIKPSFSADLGIVPPLFVVATKCRDPFIRRKAIQLLRSSSRREGMWDSELTARIGMWIAAIEEEGTGFGEPPSPYTGSSTTGRGSVGSPGSLSNESVGFSDDVPLGPGGNARWGNGGSRRESIPASVIGRAEKRTIPEDKRVMVRAVQFDLRERIATLQCGTRNLTPGMQDMKTRTTRIIW
ncbi:Aspercryptin biosynthesis cluster-specific transcription regulator atnN [Apiospora hydei]|uniref:Aspercryptin biosynthesis cluster-specific transcription regulator atnN n=1 Tax=Apiospora hydei TaxID=1337664 RepID=A0ABR1V355_9PEZI